MCFSVKNVSCNPKASLQLKTQKEELIEEEDLSQFLEAFAMKKERFGIIFFNREKNLQALLTMELTAKRRDRVIDSLEMRDCFRGPRADQVHKGLSYWEFGKEVRGIEVYIKLSLGRADESVWCMSFHPAERKIHYPLKS